MRTGSEDVGAEKPRHGRASPNDKLQRVKRHQLAQFMDQIRRTSAHYIPGTILEGAEGTAGGAASEADGAVGGGGAAPPGRSGRAPPKVHAQVSAASVGVRRARTKVTHDTEATDGAAAPGASLTPPAASAAAFGGAALAQTASAPLPTPPPAAPAVASAVALPAAAPQAKKRPADAAPVAEGRHESTAEVWERLHRAPPAEEPPVEKPIVSSMSSVWAKITAVRSLDPLHDADHST